jgi:hypothetical protein
MTKTSDAIDASVRQDVHSIDTESLDRICSLVQQIGLYVTL